MLLHDLILFLARIGTPKIDKAKQTHQMLGLGISLRPGISLVQCHSHDQQEGSEQLELQGDLRLKQGELEQDGLPNQTQNSSDDLATSNEHGILDAHSACKSREDVSAPEDSLALRSVVTDRLALPKNIPTFGKDLEAIDRTGQAEDKSELLSEIPAQRNPELYDRGQAHSHLCLVDKEAKLGSRQWRRETCHIKTAAVTLEKCPIFDTWKKSCDPTIKLCNVRFKDSIKSDFTLESNCELVNVTFVNCTFDRTIFRDIKLSDATFYHVNLSEVTLYRVRLKNVTVFKLELENAIWRANRIQNAVLSNDNLVSPSGNQRDCGFRVRSATSNATLSYVPAALCMLQLRSTHRVYGAWGRDIYRVPPIATDNILSRLTQHSDIFDRIMQYCFPGNSTHIFEYPPGVSIPREETSPDLYFANSHSISKHKTTYFGSLQSNTPFKQTGVPIEVPQRGIGNCTGLLLVNTDLHALASKHLYNRDFHFQCSAEGAREFLLAHREKIQMVKELVLYYHWGPDELVLSTGINAWRHLLATIRHQCSFFQNIRLHIGQFFWKNNKWAKGAKEVLSECSTHQCPITDAYKFAAPEDRSRFERGVSVHRTDGTLLQIEIEDTDTREKRAFVKSLAEEIEKRRVGRPLFVRSPRGGEVAYKCAEQVLKG